MKRFLVLLFVLAGAAQAAETYYAKGSPGGTTFANSAPFVATPAYTSYAITVQSALTPNKAGHLKWTVLPSAPVLKDPSGNIIPTTWTQIRKSVVSAGESTAIDLASYISNAITGLTPGTTYTLTVFRDRARSRQRRRALFCSSRRRLAARRP